MSSFWSVHFLLHQSPKTQLSTRYQKQVLIIGHSFLQKSQFPKEHNVEENKYN